MRLLLLLLLSLPAYGQILDPIFQAPPAGGTTPSLVQDTSFPNGSNPTSHAYTSNVITGNCLVVGVGWYDLANTVASVVGSVSGSFAQAQTSGTGEGAGFNTAIWYKKVPSPGGAETVTVTFSGGGGVNTNGETLHMYEFTGLTCVKDVANGQNDSTTGSQTNPTSGNFTTTATNDLVVGMIIKSANQPTGAGGLSDTIITTQDWYEVSGYRIQASATSTNAAWTSGGSNPYAAVGAAFK